MEPRNGKGASGLKGKLYIANAGDVVYSKIDVRNGAIGIVPENMPTVAVTSEFPVYSVRDDVALPMYIKLLFRTDFFQRTINGMISGASGRKRVQPSQLIDVDVPIPPLPVQQAIIDRWQDAQKEIAAASGRVRNLEKEIIAQFLKSLGLPLPKAAIGTRAFAVPWQDFARWSVSYNQIASSMIDLGKGLYPVVSMGSIIEMLQYGTSEKANVKEEGTLVIRMNNIIDGELNLTKMKHVILPVKTIDTLKLKKGDILINRTNSKELVGKCGVFHSEGEYVFASYLIRVRVDSSKVLPEYLAYAINSPLGRQQVNALSRQIIGQANINSQELRSLQIPLPALKIQKEILAHLAGCRAEIAQVTEATQRTTSSIKSEIEGLILGKRKITL
jgi:type I restriction enzyme S subunit